MLAGLLVAIALLAEPASAAPADPAPADPPPAADTQANAADGKAKAPERCPTLRNAQPGEIVVCAERPQGYRLDPDVMEANRAKRGGRPKRPERIRDTSCASVGPAGCMGSGGIDLLGAALTLGTMAVKAARGENVGKMFVTDPQRSEYQLYVEAKRAREAEEAEAAAVKAAKAKAAVKAGLNPDGSLPQPHALKPRALKPEAGRYPGARSSLSSRPYARGVAQPRRPAGFYVRFFHHAQHEPNGML